MELVDLAVQAVDGTKVSSNASANRSYDAAGLRGLLERLERAIADLEAQNEAGEDNVSYPTASGISQQEGSERAGEAGDGRPRRSETP